MDVTASLPSQHPQHSHGRALSLGAVASVLRLHLTGDAGSRNQLSETAAMYRETGKVCLGEVGWHCELGGCVQDQVPGGEVTEFQVRNTKQC